MLHMQLNACVRLLGIESEAVIIDNDNPLIIMCLNFFIFLLSLMCSHTNLAILLHLQPTLKKQL